MTKFNKGYNFKIVSLSVAVVFFLNSAVYGIDLSNKANLRVPVASQGLYGRAQTVLQKIQQPSGRTTRRSLINLSFITQLLMCGLLLLPYKDSTYRQALFQNPSVSIDTNGFTLSIEGKEVIFKDKENVNITKDENGIITAVLTENIVDGDSRTIFNKDEEITVTKYGEEYVVDIDLGRVMPKGETVTMPLSKALLCVKSSRDRDVFQLETSPGSPDVYLMYEHGAACSGWEAARINRKLKDGAVLIHIDQHDDMTEPLIEGIQRPKTLEEAVLYLFGMNNFIPPEVYNGLVDEIYWVIPRPANTPSEEGEEWDTKFFVCKLQANDGTDFIYFRPYDPKDSKDVIEGGFKIVGSVRNVMVHKMRIDRLPSFKKDSRDVILDIDEDGYRSADYRWPSFEETLEEERDIIDKDVSETASVLKDRGINPKVVSITYSGRYAPYELHTFIAGDIVNRFSEGDIIKTNGLCKVRNRNKTRSEIWGIKDNRRRYFEPKDQGSIDIMPASRDNFKALYNIIRRSYI